MKFNIKWFCAVMLLIFLTAPLSAQSKLYLGPHLGIHKADDAENSDVLVGATGRLKISKKIGIEGAISYKSEEYFGDDVSVRIWPITVTGLIYPVPAIYGGLGVGWYNTTIDYDDALGIEDETTQEFGWHLEAGVELPASSNFIIFGDIKYVFLDYDLADLPEVADDDVNADFYAITFGVLFRL